MRGRGEVENEGSKLPVVEKRTKGGEGREGGRGLVSAPYLEGGESVLN